VEDKILKHFILRLKKIKKHLTIIKKFYRFVISEFFNMTINLF